jgi:hypothetical protein
VTLFADFDAPGGDGTTAVPASPSANACFHPRPATTERTIRGLTPTPDGINYAIRLNDEMRIIHGHDLRSAGTTALRSLVPC